MTEVALGPAVCALVSIKLCIYLALQNRFHAKKVAVAH